MDHDLIYKLDEAGTIEGRRTPLQLPGARRGICREELTAKLQCSMQY